MSRTFVIGDIHARYTELKNVLNRCSFDYENDVLISLGDIVDRGFEPFECMKELDKIKNIIKIRGNHDDVLWDWIREETEDNKPRLYTHGFQGKHGSLNTMNSYLNLLDEEKEYVKSFLQTQIPYYIDSENRVFVHGGFYRDYEISKQPGNVLYWDRELFSEVLSMQNLPKETKIKTVENFNEIYIGHTPTLLYIKKNKIYCESKTYNIEPKPINILNLWNMDTGAGYDKIGRLTIMNIETKEIFQEKIN